MRLLTLTLGLVLPFLAQSDEFNSTWYDGQAELNGYQLTVSRYGQERAGSAVLIYVTEPFDEAARVKSDKPDENTFNAIKLNMVRDFQTGIYDYNTMVSIFCHDTTLEAKKVSFSSAEWCGHVYEEQIVDPHEIRRQVRSYFQGESISQTIESKNAGILEDQLFILLRSLRGDFVAPGESISTPFFPGPYYSRLSHREPRWTTATLTRSRGTEVVTVPAGEFVSHRYTLEIENDRRGTFWVEDAYPHRIIRWRLLPDVQAELKGSTRLPYWRLHDNGQESYLREIGFR